jgi:hypothetical protein
VRVEKRKHIAAGRRDAIYAAGSDSDALRMFDNHIGVGIIA